MLLKRKSSQWLKMIWQLKITRMVVVMCSCGGDWRIGGNRVNASLQKFPGISRRFEKFREGSRRQPPNRPLYPYPPALPLLPSLTPSTVPPVKHLRGFLLGHFSRLSLSFFKQIYIYIHIYIYIYCLFVFSFPFLNS